MTTTTTGRASRRRQLAAPATMLAGGGALTGATAAGGAALALTITEAVLTVAFSVAFWLIARTRGDFGAVFGSRPDERQRTIDLRATAAAGLAVGLLCIVMSVITLARGGDGNPWVAICAVFGAVYVIALAIFRR
jgi:hypothetical protein